MCSVINLFNAKEFTVHLSMLKLWSAVLVMLWLTRSSASDDTGCFLDGQCSDGFYCENLTCRECLKCKDFERENPTHTVKCIKSVVECGPCLKGLVQDLSNDVNAPCVPPQPPSVTTWVVAAVLVGVIVSVAVGIFIYFFRKKDTFKMQANIGASVESPPPTAPPPPYELPSSEAHATYHPQGREASGNPAELAVGNTFQPLAYTDLRASTPDSLPSYSVEEDSRRPFIKRASPPPPGRGRAAAGHQAARVFNRPAYDDPNYQDPVFYNDGSDNEVLDVHDDETVESPWTPSVSSDNTSNTVVATIGEGGSSGAGDVGNGSLSTQLETARGTVLVRPPRDSLNPPAKKLRVSHDTNNNDNQAGGEPSISGGSSASVSGFKLNVQVQLDALHKHGAPR